LNRNKALKELEAQWYKHLEALGFEDIEDTGNPNRPLKEWHSFKIASQRFQIIQATRSPYQRDIDNFLNHPAFAEICICMVKHGNSKFSPEQVQFVWELHVQGLTTRKIALRLGRVKSRIDDIIKGMREWMKLV
jgi:hypothetical protein